MTPLSDPEWINTRRRLSAADRKRIARALGVESSSRFVDGAEELAQLHRAFEADDRRAVHHRRGRPEKDALGIFINQLALIWEQVHGRFPGRTFNPYTGEQTGRFTRFVSACLRAIDPFAKPPDRLIRKVIHGRTISAS